MKLKDAKIGGRVKVSPPKKKDLILWTSMDHKGEWNSTKFSIDGLRGYIHTIISSGCKDTRHKIGVVFKTGDNPEFFKMARALDHCRNSTYPSGSLCKFQTVTWRDEHGMISSGEVKDIDLRPRFMARDSNNPSKKHSGPIEGRFIVDTLSERSLSFGGRILKEEHTHIYDLGHLWLEHRDLKEIGTDELPPAPIEKDLGFSGLYDDSLIEKV